MSELLPCPKCGRMPEITIIEQEGKEYYRFECQGIGHHPLMLAQPYKEAVKTWNEICTGEKGKQNEM